MVISLPSSTTPGELDQAQRLILKGKEFASRGDPKMQRIVQFLRERGFESTQTAKIRQDFLARQQADKQLQIAITKRQPQIIRPQQLPSISRQPITPRPQQKITLGISAKKSLSLGRGALDFVSGGYLTERRINKKQQSLNKDIQLFNQRFEGKELSQAEYRKAQNTARAIKLREKLIIKEEDKLAKSLKSKLGGLWDMTTKRRTSEQVAKEIKANEPRIKKKEAELKKVESKIKSSSSKFNIKRLEAVKSGIKSELGRLKTGERAKILTGDLPLVPVYNIPSGVTNIKFLGTQRKGKGGKILTDIVFKTDKGRVGIAKGVTVAKGKTSSSVVLGRSGRVAFKFPTTKAKVIKVKSFIGRERAVTKPTTLAISKNVQLLSKSKRAGTVTKITKNIKALQQKGIGQVGTVAGKKFMKGGKAVKGIRIDDFASISAIFTKKDLSLIVGKSITEMGAKSRFIGMIKGTKGVSTYGLSAGQKQQYTKALQKVISVASASLSKAEKTKGLTKAVSLATASSIAIGRLKRPIPGKTAITKIKAKPEVIPKFTPPITKVKIKAITKQLTPTQNKKVKQIENQKVKIIEKQKQVSKQITKQKKKSRTRQTQLQKGRIAQKTRQLVKQAQKLATKQKEASKQVIKTVGAKGVPVFRGGYLVGFKLPKKKKGKVSIKRKVIKKQAYNVYARPLKRVGAKKKPKLIKVNKVPLKKKPAKNLRNYIVDTSLSRTGKIKKTKGTPKRSKLNIPSGYSKRTSHKFRRYRIVKGKRKTLPKGRVIEKRNRLLDTRGEKRQITLRKRISQIRKRPVGRPKMAKPRGRPRVTKPVGRPRVSKPIGRPRRTRPVGRPTRTQTPSQRKTMLSNLEKGRAKRMSNLKKRKR